MKNRGKQKTSIKSKSDKNNKKKNCFKHISYRSDIVFQENAKRKENDVSITRTDYNKKKKVLTVTVSKPDGTIKSIMHTFRTKRPYRFNFHRDILRDENDHEELLPSTDNELDICHLEFIEHYQNYEKTYTPNQFSLSNKVWFRNKKKNKKWRISNNTSARRSGAKKYKRNRVQKNVAYQNNFWRNSIVRWNKPKSITTPNNGIIYKNYRRKKKTNIKTYTTQTEKKKKAKFNKPAVRVPNKPHNAHKEKGRSRPTKRFQNKVKQSYHIPRPLSWLPVNNIEFPATLTRPNTAATYAQAVKSSPDDGSIVVKSYQKFEVHSKVKTTPQIPSLFEISARPRHRAGSKKHKKNSTLYGKMQSNQEQNDSRMKPASGVLSKACDRCKGKKRKKKKNRQQKHFQNKVDFVLWQIPCPPIVPEPSINSRLHKFGKMKTRVTRKLPRTTNKATRKKKMWKAVCSYGLVIV